MELLLTGLTLTAIVVFVIPLAVLRAGIRRQHRTGTLTCQAPGLSAAIARRACGLYTRTPATGDNFDHEHCRQWPRSEPDGRRTS
jgi:hypothetical protein